MTKRIRYGSLKRQPRKGENIMGRTYATYLALSRANSASNLSLHATNVSIVTGSPCGIII